MKDNKNIIDKVKAYFSETPELENLEVVEKKPKTKDEKEKFEDVTLADGVTIVSVDPALEPNAVITTITEDGEVVPMLIGEYELSDGRMIIVEVDGVIAEIKETTVEEEGAPVDEDLSKDKPTDDSQRVRKVIESIVKESVFVTAKDFEEFKEEFAEMKTENEFLTKENNAIKEKFAELKEYTGKAVNELFETPTKEPIKKKINPFEKKEKTYFGVKIKNN